MATEGISDVHYFNSAMANAPVLKGDFSNYSAIAVLRGCLINGFGDQAPQGAWAAVFSSVDKLVLQTTEPVENPPFLQVDDAGPQTVKLRGYESMSSDVAGLYPFPTVSQQLYGEVFIKADSGSSTPRPWVLVADSRSLFFFVDHASNNNWTQGFYFGEFIPYNDNDLFKGLLIGDIAGGNFALSFLSVTDGSWLSRDYTGVAGTQLASARYSFGRTANMLGGSGPTYPFAPRNKLEVWPIEVWDTTAVARGLLPGLWNPIHSSIAHGTIIDGASSTNNRTMLIQKTDTLGGFGALDLTGPWRDDGPYGISGTISELFVPGSYRVCLFRQSDMRLVKTTWSGGDGSYAFANLSSQLYVVTAYDHTDPKRRPVSQANVEPS